MEFKPSEGSECFKESAFSQAGGSLGNNIETMIGLGTAAKVFLAITVVEVFSPKKGSGA